MCYNASYMRQCTLCKAFKPITQFYLKKKGGNNYCSRCKLCELKYAKERYNVPAIRQRILSRLGSKCNHCGFSDLRALQIDHINGGGKQHIASFNGNYRNYYKHVEQTDLSGFQALCANCNWIKRYEHKECPNDNH